MTISYESLMTTIGEVAKAERITKEGLRTLSRDMLEYVLETEDVRPVNALLGQGEDDKFVLTPINWRIAVQYFHHFIAFTSNYDEAKEYAVKGTGERVALEFTKKSKKRWDKCTQLIGEWLEEEANDIWVWSNNAEMDAKPVDYAKRIQQAIKTALAEDKGNMELADVMAVVASMDEVGIYDLMAAMDRVTGDAAVAEAA